MASGIHVHTPRWFVLNHIGISLQEKATQIVDKFNDRQGHCLELFAPTYVVREERHGETKMRTASLTFHYVFVRGTLPDVKKLCGQSNGFSFLIDRGNTERYATVTDREMANFKSIARAYKNCLPYFPLEDVDLEEGDLVEVVNGDFPGLIGRYMPKPKCSSGNIMLNIYNKVGTIAFNVRAKDVRVLEFSEKSTRANDQIDAFVPQLLDALRLDSQDQPLPPPLVAKLTVFCRRMEIVRLGNRKLNARLQALLFGANHILGRAREAAEARERYDKLRDSVTNEWTAALIALIFAVADGTPDSLRPLRPRLGAPASKMQRLIAAAIARHLP